MKGTELHALDAPVERWAHHSSCSQSRRPRQQPSVGRNMDSGPEKKLARELLDTFGSSLVVCVPTLKSSDLFALLSRPDHYLNIIWCCFDRCSHNGTSIPFPV